ncbi:hypothetical protein SynMEDNS5_01820 [Synechococcus sp. MEDNS5]|uniref:hypothetical protein n=1 Tax=Synechococcus sp. MEDNS5 TaxID=1442554 RepID=UPI0016473120|nr:hypothetical protein [Synechococcus sp. MEDNS5]QNJ06535.1 hypothetical protein SynMEDNS5_01820 [Synechococcus sp. MEDNS5]
MKLITALAALTLIAAPVQAGNQADYQNCLKLKAEVNAIQAGLGDKTYDCKRVKNWKSPADRIKAVGGKTALIRKCEAIWKPQLKDQRSYRYQNAQVIATDAKTFKVNVQYTATNSFGGRVPGKFSCNFGA